MAVKTFAAIDVGSYEIAIKVFEISAKNGLKEIDHVRHRIELGTDTYHTGKISYARMDELCTVLSQFQQVMDTYQVKNYQACATSAIRETENTRIVLDQIRLRTGLNVEVISNSEQRFLDYKSVALRGEKFDRIIEKGTAFLDIGGGSTQISLFDHSRLLTTQNLRLGILRLRDKIADLRPKTIRYEQYIEELVDNELHTFRKLYLKDFSVENVIVVDDYIPFIIEKMGEGIHADMVTGERYLQYIDLLKTKSPEQISLELGIPTENAELLLPSAVLIKHIVEGTNAKLIWMPGVSLSDGMAYDYAEKENLIRSRHDFSEDILSSAQNISRRYRGSKSRSDTLQKVSLAVFDCMKKMDGMSKRDRLLLQLSAILQDCGKYISSSAVGECSYHVIMNTEIIGISHKEREIIAQTVKNSYMKFIYYDELVTVSELDREAYLTVAKLTAILRTASGLSRSPKKEYECVKAVLKDSEMMITVLTEADISLEIGLFDDKTAFFEEVFGIHPVVKMKRMEERVK